MTTPVSPTLHSEIAGTVSLSHDQDNSSPPSFDEDPEASAPTNRLRPVRDSLSRLVRGARRIIVGFVAYLTGAIIILLGGSEEDEEEEDDDDDDNYENVEDGESDSANEDNDKSVTIVEKKNYLSPMLKTSPNEFFSNPNSISLIALHKAKEDLLSVLPKETTVDDYLKLFVKICSVVKPEDTDAKFAACNYADDILPKAIESSSIPIFNDKFLVHLGLLKGEDMKHPVGMDITGALSVLQHSVKQSYFDDTTRSLLKFFLSRPLNVSACEKTKHALMQILYQI